MNLPKFLIADNDEYPENTYVVHTQSPRFIVDVDTEEYQILENEEVNLTVIKDLISEALSFHDEQLEQYEEDEI